MATADEMQQFPETGPGFAPPRVVDLERDSWAAPAGTASTPTTMFLSRTMSLSLRSSSTVVPPTSEPIMVGLESKTAAMLMPCSAKIGELAIAWPSRPAPISAMLC
jgi:hypothetical protein